MLQTPMHKASVGYGCTPSDAQAELVHRTGSLSCCFRLALLCHRGHRGKGEQMVLVAFPLLGDTAAVPQVVQPVSTNTTATLLHLG